MKGQAEIIVIVGILIVAAVVILYAVPQIMVPPAPAAVAEEQKTVKASVENFIQAGAQDALRKITNYGGWLGPQANSVTYLGKLVPYWQHQGTTNYPDLRTNFITGLSTYLRNNKDSLEQSLAAKNVTLGTPSVNANILDGQIMLTVNMPTSVKGYPIAQPYSLSIQTKLGEIYSFSRSFIEQTLDDRYFEYYTLANMFISPIDDGFHTVPVAILLTRCGEYVYKDWFDIKPAMEEQIKTTLAHTYMPAKMPLNIGERTGYAKYNLPAFNGKRYEDLDVSFFLPDDFELTLDTFQFEPNPIQGMTEPVAFTGACQAPPIYIRYYLTYPVIVEIRDSLTGNLFKFALTTYIKDNNPGKWEDFETYSTSVQAMLCKDPKCSISLQVADSQNNPLSEASVSWMGCNLGLTGPDGMLTSPASCGIGVLQVRKAGYGIDNRMSSSDEITDMSINLFKPPFVNLYFYKVYVENLSLTNQYEIGVDDVELIGEDEIIWLTFYSMTDSQKVYRKMFDTRSATISRVEPDLYSISATLSNSEMTEVYGATTGIYFWGEELENLYVYLPYTIEFGLAQTDEEKTYLTHVLSSLLKNCNLGPMNETESDLENALPCIKGYEEI